MKTANEWCKENEQAWESGDGEACKLVVVDETVIKQIQLDAMREGMRRAASVKLPPANGELDFWLKHNQAILSAANSFTEQDIAATTGTTLAK